MKYQNTTIIQIAQDRGSAATTKVGAWRFLLKRLKSDPDCQFGTSFSRNVGGVMVYHTSNKRDWTDYNEKRMDRRATGRAIVLGYDIDDPYTPGRIWNNANEENAEWNLLARSSIERDNYGSIDSIQHYFTFTSMTLDQMRASRAKQLLFNACRELIERAVKKGLIVMSYDTITRDSKGRFDGDAIHHEIYDIAKNAVVFCVREAEGSRYGVKTTQKTYFLITFKYRKFIVSEVQAQISRMAKQNPSLGVIIKKCLRKRGQ